jgi:uncharacterized membrane protein YkvI
MSLATSVLRSVWTGGGGWALSQAVLLTVLLAALVVKVLMQGALRSPNRKLLRALNVVIAPLLIVFLVVVVQRFRVLGP